MNVLSPPPPRRAATDHSVSADAAGARRRRRWWWLAVPVLALGALLLWVAGVPPRQQVPPPSPVPAAAPPAVVGLGWIEPASTVIRIGAPGNPDAARVGVLAVGEGDIVAAGQLLAALDNEAQRVAQLAQAEATLRLREVQLARQQADYANQAAARRAAVDRTRAERTLAEAEHARQGSLVSTSAASRAAFERAVRDLAQATANLSDAEAALARVLRTLDGAPDGVPIDIAVAMAERDAARADIASARTALELARIRAPFGGVVLALKARPGERITSDGLLELGGTERMRAVIEVYQTDIARVRVGQPVTLRADAFAAPITGAVERVGNAIRRQTVINADPATSTDARIVEVFVSLTPEASQRVRNLSRLQVTGVFAR
jgi:HlyD family secretion protein